MREIKTNGYTINEQWVRENIEDIKLTGEALFYLLQRLHPNKSYGEVCDLAKRAIDSVKMVHPMRLGEMLDLERMVTIFNELIDKIINRHDLVKPKPTPSTHVNPDKPIRALDKWEYLREVIDSQLLQDRLNARGAEGWELDHLTPRHYIASDSADSADLVVFKRKVK